MGSTISDQQFDSEIFQILENNSVTSFEGDDLNNDVEYHFSDTYLGAHYKLITGKLTINPGLSAHYYHTRDTQLGTENSNDFTRLLPDLFAMYQFKRSESLRLNYSMTTAFSDISKIAEGYVFNNYQSMYSGNRNLESSINHNLNLGFFSFNMFNYTRINASANYTKRIDAVKNSSTIEGIDQISTSVNSVFPDETFSLSGRAGKSMGKVEVKASARLNYNITNNQFRSLNGTTNRETNSFTQNYEASVETNFAKGVNFEVGYNRTINDYDNGAGETTYFTDRPFVNMEVNFLKNLSLLADYSYYNYTDAAKTIDNNYSFLNADLYYQKTDSPWEFSLGVKNLTDNQSINNDSFNPNNNSTSTSQYFVQPRFLTLGVKYDL